MTPIRILLNLPWTLLGLVGAVLSGPSSVRFNAQPVAIIIAVRSFWWLQWLPGYKGVRAAAWGNTVAEGPHLLPHDDIHELIHVEQAMRRPLIQPILYLAESIRHDSRHNRFEQEAYRRAGNPYLE